MTIQLSSTGFDEGQTIPKQHTGDGRNSSPPLRWQDAPAGTASWALICEDPDAPRGTFTHWVLYNLPASARELSEGVPADTTLADGALQGVNDFGKVGYGGPAPPRGKPHRYLFKLFALARPLDLPPGATKAQVLTAMKGQVLGEGLLMGTYAR